MPDASAGPNTFPVCMRILEIIRPLDEKESAQQYISNSSIGKKNTRIQSLQDERISHFLFCLRKNFYYSLSTKSYCATQNKTTFIQAKQERARWRASFTSLVWPSLHVFITISRVVNNIFILQERRSYIYMSTHGYMLWSYANMK